jgi:predicted ATPase/DNA-binding CsgD family transcriptional regulator
VGDAAVAAAGSVHGFVPALTSFVGRAGELDELAGLLGNHRLVTVTGPGGVGKTRLAAEVARQVAERFADGVWLVELAAVGEPALVPAAVAVALEVRQPPGVSLPQALARVLARRQLLLVLDNCEHVAAAVAELCGALLPTADDVRVLATSREPLGIAGEARYRLPTLTLPEPDHLTDVGGSEAVALFADRARQADAHFALSTDAGPLVAQLVARLDGMPLAIELAAARVESLGVGQLLDRLDDRFALLAGGDRLAAPRHRSLAATMEWSYRLLGEDGQQVFRRLAVFPGPFTLEAAEAVAGAAAGPMVLHLVDCSLLTPPRTGPDGRARYLMLETLRAYGVGRLAESGEQPDAAAVLAAYALQVAEQATVGLQASGGEAAAARRLDAEDATTQQVLTWALEHDRLTALRLAIALAPWWLRRGRSEAGYMALRAAAGHAARDQDMWRAGQLWLGLLADSTSNLAAALSHFTAVRDAPAAGGPSPELVVALGGRSAALRNLGQVPEAAENARRALALARELGYPAGEALALMELSWAAHYTGDFSASLEWAQRACQIGPAGIPDWVARWCGMVMTVALIEAGQAASAQRSCANWLARAREVGDLQDQAFFLGYMAEVDRRADRLADAGTHLRESLELAVQVGDRLRLIDCLDTCGHLCAATGRWAEAITVWAAHAAHKADTDILDLPQDAQRRREPMRKAAQALGSAQVRAAEERGAAMTLDTAVEFATMVTDQDPQVGPALSATGQLSPREQELVMLVAQGHTDAQIAAQLYLSVRTVRSHLDRIRDKTGYRRRADLTRLALQTGLV